MMANGNGQETKDGESTPDLEQILDEIEIFLRRYVVFPGNSEGVACVLWIAHTHVFLQFEVTPYLAITSPEKRSGKTRLLDTLELLVWDPWHAILPSEAVLFRKIAETPPTLLLDEVDTIFGKNAREHEGIRALLNAGHSKGVTVPRCVGLGSKMTVEEFKVFCPKAIAGIGRLPDTIGDRSVPIRLARRSSGEEVARFRRREAKERAWPIRDQLNKWAIGARLQNARPEIPHELNDRAADGWEPLLAIADAASLGWGIRARSAAVELHADPVDLAESRGITLLRDTKRVFDGRGVEAMFTKELIDALCDLEESPWRAGTNRWLTPHRLASLLRPYGIRPIGTIRKGEETAKGYHRDSFIEAWERYLPPSPSESGGDPSQRHS